MTGRIFEKEEGSDVCVHSTNKRFELSFKKRKRRETSKNASSRNTGEGRVEGEAARTYSKRGSLLTSNLIILDSTFSPRRSVLHLCPREIPGTRCCPPTPKI